MSGNNSPNAVSNDSVSSNPVNGGLYYAIMSHSNGGEVSQFTLTPYSSRQAQIDEQTGFNDVYKRANVPTSERQKQIAGWEIREGASYSRQLKVFDAILKGLQEGKISPDQKDLTDLLPTDLSKGLSKELAGKLQINPGQFYLIGVQQTTS